MKLLCLSNGHGEDAIALRILQQLQQFPNPPQLSALPLVGEGHLYRQQGIPLVGVAKSMPSGGFVYQDGRQLARDLRGGLLQLTLTQLKTVRSWAKTGGVVLAVGDIVPLLFAWWSGASYAFVGTAKSEYYLRDEQGLLPRRSWFENLESWSGSVYLPWERWLMQRHRCKAVFPRDSLTTQILEKWAIPVFDYGNPMMDGLEPRDITLGGTLEGTLGANLETESFRGEDRWLTVVLLPGSRVPEAYENWQTMTQAIAALVSGLREYRLRFLGAIASQLDLTPLKQTLELQSWQLVSTLPNLTFTQPNATLILTQSAFSDCLHQADIAMAMAGTATEQFVGLGKPALLIPGKGPQFTPAFAEAYTRLLGASAILVEQPIQAPGVVRSLFQDPDRLRLIWENGRRRMGQSGAAQRIAEGLMKQFKHC